MTDRTVLTQADIERVNRTLAEFYYALLSEVDARARARGAEDITDECGVALGIWAVTGSIVRDESVPEVLKHIGVGSMQDIVEMIGYFGPHVEDDHGEYLPLFREAIDTPRLRSILDQIHAAARHLDIDVPGLDTIESI